MKLPPQNLKALQPLPAGTLNLAIESAANLPVYKTNGPVGFIYTGKAANRKAAGNSWPEIAPHPRYVFLRMVGRSKMK